MFHFLTQMAHALLFKKTALAQKRENYMKKISSKEKTFLQVTIEIFQIQSLSEKTWGSHARIYARQFNKYHPDLTAHPVQAI